MMRFNASTLLRPALAAAAVCLAACASPATNPDLPVVVYPAPPEEPRIQLLARYTHSLDVEEISSFERSMAGGAEIRMGIERAYGVGWFGKRIYVCDAGKSALAVFDLEKREMRRVEPNKRGLFKKPLDLAIASDGWKYVADTAHRKVLVLDAEDRYQRAFGDPKTWRPVGIAATDDRLYVTDAENHCVVVLDRRTGEELRRFGEKGGAEGQFYFPVAIAVGPTGDLYVSDSFNFRVQQLEPDGSFVRRYGSLGRNLGNLARPKGVAVDRESRVFVLDGAFENCQIFDPDGSLLLYFGAPGEAPGSMNMPSHVRIDYDAADAFRDRVMAGFDIEYVIFVTSQTGPYRVNVYGLLRKR